MGTDCIHPVHREGLREHKRFLFLAAFDLAYHLVLQSDAGLVHCLEQRLEPVTSLETHLHLRAYGLDVLAQNLERLVQSGRSDCE